ncbi:MAG: hypothetical protein HZB55_14880 [Deltaproteobacteria bacterium]|nr:hypothetical protein [Deltaproteobacteria bacterium]
MTPRAILATALACILGGAFLVGCAATRWEVPAPCNAAGVLTQYESWERLGPEQLDAAYSQARRAFERSGSDCARLQMAALTVLQSSRKNETYALKILDDYLEANKGAGDPRTSLARLLARMLRERVDGDARTKAALKKAMDEQARADGCKRQLEDLRNVEKIIDERGTR